MSDIYEVSNVENNEVAEETSEKKDRKLGKKELLIGGGLLFGIGGLCRLRYYLIIRSYRYSYT